LLTLQASAKSSTSHRRIQVIEGRRWVPIVAPTPTLSSAPYGWDGILVERYNSVKVLEDRERTRTTAIVHLHLGVRRNKNGHLAARIELSQSIDAFEPAQPNQESTMSRST
jgi:hypothetical protein